MPLYSVYCPACVERGEAAFFELTMSLKDFDLWQAGKIFKRCPACKSKLRLYIAGAPRVLRYGKQ